MNTEKPSPWWKNTHLLMMLICIVLVPFALLEGINGNWLSALFILVCPLMHLFMMKSMGHNCDETPSNNSQPEKVLNDTQKDQTNREF